MATRALEDSKNEDNSKIIYVGNPNPRRIRNIVLSILILIIVLSFGSLFLLSNQKKIIIAKYVYNSIWSIGIGSTIVLAMFLFTIALFYYLPWRARALWRRGAAGEKARKMGLTLARNWRKVYGKTARPPVNYRGDGYCLGLKKIVPKSETALTIYLNIPEVPIPEGIVDYFEKAVSEICDRLGGLDFEIVSIMEKTGVFNLIVEDKTNEIREVKA